MAISTYQLKPLFQQSLRPILALMERRNIRPNHVTAFSLVMCCLMGTLAVVWREFAWVWAMMSGFMLVRMALNALDGMLAKSTGQITDFGKIFNELADVVSDAVLYLPFAYLPFIRGEGVVALVVVALVIELAGVSAVLIGQERRFDGPLAKSDRALGFGIAALLTACGVHQPWLVNGLISAMLVLGCLTIYFRVNRVIRCSEH